MLSSMRTVMTRSTVRGFALTLSLSSAVLLVSAACKSGISGAVPVEQYTPPQDSAAEYVIADGDTIAVQVWEQAQMSGRMKVRSDGKISVPLVGDVAASGKTPTKLAADLEASLKAIVINPKVTVIVEDSKPQTVSVLGEVSKPGPQPFTPDMGVAQVLAGAGGLTNFAHRDRIFVVRSTTKPPTRIHFTYDSLTRSVGAASMFRLKPGDVVIVE